MLEFLPRTTSIQAPKRWQTLSLPDKSVILKHEVNSSVLWHLALESFDAWKFNNFKNKRKEFLSNYKLNQPRNKKKNKLGKFSAEF